MSDTLAIDDGMKERDVAGDLIPSIALGGVVAVIAGVLFSPWLFPVAIGLFLLSGVMMYQYDWEDEESFSPTFDWKLIGGRDRTIEQHCDLGEKESVCIECGQSSGDAMEILNRHEFVLGGIPISTEEHGKTYQCEECTLSETVSEDITMSDVEMTVDEELEALLDDDDETDAGTRENEKEYSYESN